MHEIKINIKYVDLDPNSLDGRVNLIMKKLDLGMTGVSKDVTLSFKTKTKPTKKYLEGIKKTLEKEALWKIHYFNVL